MKNRPELACNHCHNPVSEGDKHCEHCGIPLPPNLATASRNKFLFWFVLIVILCVFMMVWLPPNWNRFTG